MDKDIACVALGLLGMGMLAVLEGLRFHLGHWRRWYLVKDTIFGSKAAFYGSVPLGLGLICLAVSMTLPTLEFRQLGMKYVAFPLMGLGGILMFWHPRWLQPKWVRWLEENNQDILNLIIEEGRKTKDWGKAVATQEGLEAWVAEVRRKYNRPAPVAAPGEVVAKPTTTSRPGRPTRPWPGWPVGLVVIVVSSALGQYLLGSGFIGFIGGWVVLLVIYLLRPKD